MNKKAKTFVVFDPTDFIDSAWINFFFFTHDNLQAIYVLTEKRSTLSFNFAGSISKFTLLYYYPFPILIFTAF